MPGENVDRKNEQKQVRMKKEIKEKRARNLVKFTISEKCNQYDFPCILFYIAPEKCDINHILLDCEKIEHEKCTNCLFLNISVIF